MISTQSKQERGPYLNERWVNSMCLSKYLHTAKEDSAFQHVDFLRQSYGIFDVRMYLR